MIGVTPPKSGPGTGAFQFTDPEYDAIIELIYKPSVVTFSVSPASNEKGVLAALSLAYNIKSNQDVFTAASISQGVGSVLSDVDAGNKTISGGSSIVNKSFVLSLGYTQNGVPKTQTKTATFNAYVPQFAGVSANDNLATYTEMTAALEKFVQSSATLSKKSSPSDQYIYFLSTKQTALILDQNNFQQTIGDWSNGTTEFYRKAILLTLADNTTKETVYLCRSRNKKTLSNFTYKIQ